MSIELTPRQRIQVQRIFAGSTLYYATEAFGYCAAIPAEDVAGYAQALKMQGEKLLRGDPPQGSLDDIIAYVLQYYPVGTLRNIRDENRFLLP